MEESQQTARRDLWAGIGFGLLSAIAYTLSNMALRDLTVPGDVDWAIWVTCMKAFPPAVVAWVLIAYGFSRGEQPLPPRSMIPGLLVAALFMQSGGNVMFQWSLSLSGLALVVPLVFATIICTGAVLGRFWLGELITARSVGAMGLLIVAIVLLSAGAPRAARPPAETSQSLTVLLSIVGATFSGIAYGTTGVVIRRTVSSGVSLAGSLVFFSTTGLLLCGSVAAARLGVDEIIARSSGRWVTLLLAGSTNAVAFFSIGAALKRIGVIQANLLNASQIAMCSLAGVLWFAEPFSSWLFWGTGLTVLGLGLMEKQKPAETEEPAPAAQRELVSHAVD